MDECVTDDYNDLRIDPCDPVLVNMLSFQEHMAYMFDITKTISKPQALY